MMSHERYHSEEKRKREKQSLEVVVQTRASKSDLRSYPNLATSQMKYAASMFFHIYIYRSYLPEFGFFFGFS